MSTQEFYIRTETENEARGPFTLEHLISLAENGQITRDTLYYEAATEQWAAIASNPDVVLAIFPEKKALKLKVRDNIKVLNNRTESAAPIQVTDMLAAAEGRTADTADKIDPIMAQERAANIGLWTAILLLFISSVAFILPSIDLIAKQDYGALLYQPLCFLGAIHLFLGLALILQVVSIYPLVRFVVTAGLGFVGFVLWTEDQTVPLASYASGAVGLYFCTVFVNMAGVGLAAGLGLAGMIGYAYYALT